MAWPGPPRLSAGPKRRRRTPLEPAAATQADGLREGALIRMAEANLDLARKQAEEKGLSCQTYIKSVLHEAMVKRPRRAGESKGVEHADRGGA